MTVIEKTVHNYSVYLPDISGCIVIGKTIEEAKKNITEALNMHFQGLDEDGQSSPKPKAKADYVAVS